MIYKLTSIDLTLVDHQCNPAIFNITKQAVFESLDIYSNWFLNCQSLIIILLNKIYLSYLSSWFHLLVASLEVNPPFTSALPYTVISSSSRIFDYGGCPPGGDLWCLTTFTLHTPHVQKYDSFPALTNYPPYHYISVTLMSSEKQCVWPDYYQGFSRLKNPTISDYSIHYLSTNRVANIYLPPSRLWLPFHPLFTRVVWSPASSTITSLGIYSSSIFYSSPLSWMPTLPCSLPNPNPLSARQK